MHVPDASCPPASGNWVCFACLPPAAAALPALPAGAGQIGFVSHDQSSNWLLTTGYRLPTFGFVSHGRLGPGILEYWNDGIGECRRTPWRLGLFGTISPRLPAGLLQIGFVCTDGIGLARWNDGMVGRWGISPAGNWLCFARLSPAAPGLPVLPVRGAIGFVCTTAGVAPRIGFVCSQRPHGSVPS